MTGGQQNTELTIYVTHVEAEGLFLKVWGQVDKNMATYVERSILTLIPHFERGVGCPGPQAANLVPNTMCCAKYQNDGYYRARICSIRPDGMVVVHFVDYGNVDILPSQEVHLLDNIPGTETLRTLAPVAFCFILANVLPINNVWENKTVDTIKKILWYNEYKAVLIARQDGRYLIKLNYNNEDFADLLVKKQMAVASSVQEMFRLKCVQQPQVPMYQHYSLRKESTNPFLPLPTAQEVTINPMQRHVHNCQGTWQNVQPTYLAQQKQQLQPTIQEALVFKSRVLDIGSSHNVRVSYVEDGPLKFSIQLEVLTETLNKLIREINSHPTQPLQEPPLPGAVCLGRHTEGKILCRAVVMSVMDDKCKLYYVDVGKTEVLPYKDIYQLPPQYINPKVLSIRLTLSGLRDLNVTEEMKAFFKECVLNKHLILYVRQPEGPPLIQYGDLYDNGKNVKDILSEKFPTCITYQNPIHLIKGSEEIVHVSFVESCRKFFVQLDSMIQSLESIMTILGECAGSSPPINPAKISPGMPCAALYEGHWYRAKVLTVNGDSVRVLYVDYGNEETILASLLHVIHTDLVKKLPAQAIKCSWNGCEGLPCTKEYTNQFEMLVLEKRLHMKVVDIFSNGYLVDIRDPERLESIKTQLIQIMSAAKSSKMIPNHQGEELKTQSYPQMTLQQDMQRFNAKPYPSLTEWQKIKIKAICDHTSKWHQKKQPDSRRQASYDESASNGRNKSKVWKEGINEEKQHNSRYDQSSDFSYNDATKLRSSKFARGEMSNKQNRDESGSSFNRRDKDNSAGKSRFPTNDSRLNRSGGSDKTWSDKDSDASSKGSGKRGRGNSGGRGGRGDQSKNRRDNFNARNQWNDADINMGRDTSSAKSQWNTRDNKGREAVTGKGHWNGRDHSRGTGRNNKDNIGDQHTGNYKYRDKKQESNGVYKKASSIGSWGSPSSTIRAADNTSQKEKPSKKSIIPPPKVSVGSVKECVVVYTKSPSEFYIQISPDYLELDTVMEKIASAYENNQNLLQIAEVYKGMHCIAQYTDDMKWYRAMIESLNGNNVTIVFIDYGNVESVSIDKIRSLEDEFSKLPVQAVRCKLFGPARSEWNDKQIEDFKTKAEGAILQTEMVTEKDGVYEVLIRPLTNDTSTSSYINEEFCNGVDLMKAKEDLNRQNSVTQLPDEKKTDYVSTDFKWLVSTYETGSKETAFVSWYIHPSDFYCQLQSKESEFKSMMYEIQQVYKTREPVSGNLRVGMPVIAIFSEDQALYRAEIVELLNERKHVVQYIDFGNRAIVDQFKIYPVERKFTQLPRQSVRCTLKDAFPKNSTDWAKDIAQQAYTYFNADNYVCTFHSFENDKYVISLRDGDCDIAETLINKGLAAATSFVEEYNESDFVMPVEVERVDISLLCGQTLRVQVSSVESTEKFYIRLPSATKSEQLFEKYMTNKDPKVMRRLSRREVCPGAGCLILSSGTWRRAVATNCSKSKAFQVRYIDTGACDEILLDSVLALPEQLAAIQNQALECCLKDVPSSPNANSKLQQLIKETEVIISVNDVDRNRLIVTLFDTSGRKIKFSEADEGEINPICPMPILSSTHKVTVSYAENSTNVWLQRNVDYGLDLGLQKALREYYSEPRTVTRPIVGALCAAKGADGEWYRAQVVNVVENGAYVNFIDYGNTELIQTAALMELDSKFYVPYQLSIRVSLSVALKGTDSEQVLALQSQLLKKELSAVFYNVHQKWIVEIWDKEEKLSDRFRSLGLVAEPGETNQTEEEEVHDAKMMIGKKYKVLVSHVDSPSQFWLQRIEDVAILNERRNELQSAVETFPLVEGVLEEGTLCAAIYSIDSLWYRAEVLDADEDITTVRFIDYGNTDVIDNKSGNIRQLPDDWATSKRYATKCRLDVMPIHSEDWSEAACEKFERSVNSSENLRALIIADCVPTRVDLFIKDESVSQILVAEKLASPVHAEGELIDELVDLELDPHSAFVSHVNSPGEFWVQEEKSVGDLEVMTDRFIVADMFPRVLDVREGMLCVAKFPEDGLWYRARIISHGENGTQVIYIDYGNSATSTEIREIPEDLANTSPLSRKCSLALPEGVKEWSQEACTEFLNLAADGQTIFLLDVLKEQETSLVKLTLNGRDVAELLATHCERQSPSIEERLPPLGEENSPNVFISHINGPDEFWIQVESNVSELELMSERLEGAQSFLPLDTIKVGTICAAKFPDDGHWYRGKIVSLESSEPRVLYIDYGNSANTNELRCLPEDIVNLPVLSKKCALVLPHGTEFWSAEACAKFKELAAEGETTFQFQLLNEDETTQISLSLNGNDVVDILTTSCDKNLISDDQKSINKGREEMPFGISEGVTDVEINDVSYGKPMEENTTANSQICEVIYDSRAALVPNPSATSENNREGKMNVQEAAILPSTAESTMKSDSLVDSIQNIEIEPTLESTRVSANESMKPETSKNLKIEELEKSLSKCEIEESEQENQADGIINTIENSETSLKTESQHNDLPLAATTVPELSVDDIVQSMMKNTIEEVHEYSENDVKAESSGHSEGNSSEICHETIETVENVPQSFDESKTKDEEKVPASKPSVDKIALASTDDITDTKDPSDKDSKFDAPPFETSATESTSVYNSCPESAFVGTPPTTPKIHHEDKIVPGCISRGESPNPFLERPATPKTPHSEKLVAGAVIPCELIAENEDETIAVLVHDRNIPMDKQ